MYACIGMAALHAAGAFMLAHGQGKAGRVSRWILTLSMACWRLSLEASSTCWLCRWGCSARFLEWSMLEAEECMSAN